MMLLTGAPHRSFFSIWLIALVVLLNFSSCKVTKNFKPGETLLQRNKVVIVDKISAGTKERLRNDLLNIAAQKPNKKVFGFMPVKLWFYTAADQPKQTKFRKWLKARVGEAPVIYDSLAIEKTVMLYQNYLSNYGYFANQVTYSVEQRKRKRTRVHYQCQLNAPWKIGQVSFTKDSTHYAKVVAMLAPLSKLRPGENFEVTKLKAERDRIETDLRNSGYYFFSRDYVTFVLDSNTTSRVVNVKVGIVPPTDSTLHRQYRMRNFYIYEDYAIEKIIDTIPFDSVVKGEFHIYYHKLQLKPRFVVDALFMKQGDMYAQELHAKTLRRLNDLNIFRFISIDYVAVKDTNLLDCIIFLTPSKKQSLGGSGEVNVNIEGFFGVAGTFSYRNKNLTKGADLFLIDLTGGVQFLFGEKQKVQPVSYDVGVSSTYYLNRFLFPLRKNNRTRYLQPKTRFNLSYNFETRYDLDTSANRVFLYKLHNFNLGFGYDWNQNRFTRHIVSPVNINFYLLPEKGQTFADRLAQNPALQNSYSEQFILGPSYTLVYSNQVSKAMSRFVYYRLNLETAGNILYGGYALADINKDLKKPYSIANLNFSQFVRTDHDFRFYQPITYHSYFVWRAYFGIGYAYGNSTQLPFIKQFYVGGPNSLRGFNIREIGPGGYVDTLLYDSETKERKDYGFFNQTGDLKLETNIEFRFDIYKWLKGAVFADAGNVWLVRKDTARTHAEFDFSRSWKDFAIDVGAGLRLDFSFFVIRFDYGFPIRDPRIQTSNKWTFNKGQFQLAVGYPF